MDGDRGTVSGGNDLHAQDSPTTVSVQGKPTIIFSTNANDEAWRFKEKIAAVIGSFLQGRDDLYTFSSISIRDIVNDLENLDVAYANIDDPTDLFSFIEVRDRKEKVSRQYIQEIMGKRESLAIESCEIVSTRGFTRNAKRLASKVGIPLRLLVPAINLDAKRWFVPDHIKLHGRLASIERCSIVARMEHGFQKFEADRSKSSSNNVLASTDIAGTYKSVSLAKIFDIEIIAKEEHCDAIFQNVPVDNSFHKATVAYKYGDACIYHLRVRDHGVVPIAAIVFFVHVSNTSIDAPIKNRFRYIDAVDGKTLAEVICAEAMVQQQLNYVALVRHSCDGQNCRLGGAFFW